MVNQKKFIKNISWQLFIQLSLLTIGIFFTSVNHFQHQKSLDAQINEALNERINFLSNGVNERLELYLFALNSMRSAIHGIGVNKLNYQSIANYSKSHNYQSALPGANGIGYIKKVSVKDINDFITHAREERADNQFTLRTLSEHQEAKFIIQYIFPENKNRKAIGLDIGSETIRREAALNASLHNQGQLSAPITLVQANKKTTQGFLILLPVYNTIDAPESKDPRFKNTVGWTYSPLLIGSILESLSQFNTNYLSILDVTNNLSINFYNDGNKDDVTKYITSKVIHIIGRDWRIELKATNAFITSLNLNYKYSALFNSLLLTLLIMLITFIIQFILFKKAQNIQLKMRISSKHKKALEEINSSLESEVKNRTQQLADVNMRQRSILNSASYLIISTDIQGIITGFNPKAERLLGYKAENLIGVESPALFHLPEEVIEKAKQLSIELNRPIEPGFDVFIAKTSISKPDICKWTYVSSDGKHIPIQLSVTPLLSDDGDIVGYLGMSFDLTKQIAHEKSLAQAKDIAEKATQAKSEFLANMSHEIRTPMNGLFGTLQLLEELPHDKQSCEYINKALYSTKALNTIINDILDFSKIEAGKLVIEKTVFQLSELLNSLTSDISISAKEKGIDFKLISQVEHQYWLGDPARLRQVLLNLISNAIKFTHQGTVTFEVMLTKHSEILFIISDTGIGISQDALSRLFQRFEQADTSTTRKYGGTGLGLTITKSLIDLMNGRIEVTSQLELGSQFSIYIPLEKANEQPSNINTKVCEYPDFTDKTILLAEDNKINQLVAQAMLKPTNANIIIANDGHEAISQYQQYKPDIILMDIQMPNMDGIEACRQIKALDPEQKIVAFTANVLSEQKELYEQLFNGYLAKPIEKNKLIEMLHSLTDTKALLL